MSAPTPPIPPSAQSSASRTDRRSGPIVVLVGHPRPRSRTRVVAEQLASALVTAAERSEVNVESIDLAELGPALVDPSAPALEAAITAVTGARVLIVATPVFKGTYTGVLKVFLDRLDGEALSGLRTVPVTVAGSTAHRDGADNTLRPVLAELGADLVPTSLTLEESELPNSAKHAQDWIAAHQPVPTDVSGEGWAARQTT